jgi:hypothetical protein
VGWLSSDEFNTKFVSATPSDPSAGFKVCLPAFQDEFVWNATMGNHADTRTTGVNIT